MKNVIVLGFCLSLFASCTKEIIVEKTVEISHTENGIIWPGVRISHPADSLFVENGNPIIEKWGVPMKFLNIPISQRSIPIENTGPKNIFFINVATPQGHTTWFEQIEAEVRRRGYKPASLSDALGMIREYGDKDLMPYNGILFLKGPIINNWDANSNVENAAWFYYDTQAGKTPTLLFYPKNVVGYSFSTRVAAYLP